MMKILVVLLTWFIGQSFAEFKVLDEIFAPPDWTTATRPACPSNYGCIGYNVDINNMEFWNGTTWGVVGNGDVVGPATATDNTIARYDSTTGKLLQGSGVTISDTDAISGVASLNVSGVGSFGTATPDANAILDLSSTTKAFLMPRMTTTQMNAIPSPTNGMQVFNTDAKKLHFYNGTGWEPAGMSEALFSLGIVDANPYVAPPVAVYKAGDFYVVNGFGALGAPFIPSVTTAGTGDYLVFNDNATPGNTADDTWDKIEFSNVGQIVRAGNTVDSNLMAWDGANTNSAKDSLIPLANVPTMPNAAVAAGYGVISIGANKSLGTTTFKLPNTNGTAGFVLTSDGAGDTSWSASGNGDVLGPASSVANTMAMFDGVTGKLLKESSYTFPTADCALGEVLKTDASGNFICSADIDTTVVVEDVLTSTSAVNALSANQGKVLNDTKISGPASVIDSTLAMFDGTTGKLAKSTPYKFPVASCPSGEVLQSDGTNFTCVALAQGSKTIYNAYGLAGLASTNTSSFYFSGVKPAGNTDCYSVTNNSTEGFYITVNKACILNLSMSISSANQTVDAGFSLNPSAGELTTSFSSLPAAKKLCDAAVLGAGGAASYCSASVDGVPGQKIYLQGPVGATYSSAAKFYVSIAGFEPGIGGGGGGGAALTVPTCTGSQRLSGNGTALICLDNTYVASPGTNIDWATSHTFFQDVAGNTTFTFSNQVNGQMIILAVRNTTGSTVQINLPASIWVGATPIINLGATSTTIYTVSRLNNQNYIVITEDLR